MKHKLCKKYPTFLFKKKKTSENGKHDRYVQKQILGIGSINKDICICSSYWNGCRIDSLCKNFKKKKQKKNSMPFILTETSFSLPPKRTVFCLMRKDSSKCISAPNRMYNLETCQVTAKSRNMAENELPTGSECFRLCFPFHFSFFNNVVQQAKVKSDGIGN